MYQLTTAVDVVDDLITGARQSREESQGEASRYGNNLSVGREGYESRP